jgi:glycosyltransferase involved in cell wall biosynthesis
MQRICIYFKEAPDKDRWLLGDRFIRGFIRKLFRKRKVRGVEKVFINLCKSFEAINVPFIVNLPFSEIQTTDAVIVLGTGKHVLKGYNKQNKIIAGIGLMTHPSQWPGLCEEYPIAKYLQHSEWANNIYLPYFGKDVCALWPAGIETNKWNPANEIKEFDILVYCKIHWESEEVKKTLVNPIFNELQQKGIRYSVISYGSYSEEEYYKKLASAKALIYITEHESQGFACCEAMAMNLPVMAWDQGYVKDPNRFLWGQPNIRATSVPFFDQRCGTTFYDFKDFQSKLDNFLAQVNNGYFEPRNYILENLTLEKSAVRMLNIINEVYS